MMFNKKYLLFLFFISAFLSITSFADTARNITSEVEFVCNNISEKDILDDNIATHSKGSNITITISAAEKIGGIYIKYNNKASSGMLNEKTPIGENGFVHEFIPLTDTYKAELSFREADICDLLVFSTGELSKDIQVWQKGNNKTDLLLCPTHSDDDQLFFAGILPYYAGVKKANVMVAYFTNHFDTYNRTHELLDGLWECGITNYPDIAPFPDGWSESIDEAVSFLENKGFTYEDVLSYQKSLIEKYQPLVAVLHDFNGEYGHGAHMLNTKSFVEAFEKSDGYIPEKVYVHLYDENKIKLDIDTPLKEFDGLSAFQVSQKAFLHHKSQHWTWLYGWLYGKAGQITNSGQIKIYNPAYYGLYFSRIGNDTQKNCLFENVTLYRDRKIILPSASDYDFVTQKGQALARGNIRNKSEVSLLLVLPAIIFISAISLIIIIKKKR